MEIADKISQMEKKIQQTEARIERDQQKLEAYRKELESLRFLRYDSVRKELNLSDEELIRFLRQMKARTA